MAKEIVEISRFGLALIASLILSACSIAPGMRMPDPPVTYRSMAASAPVNINFIPIDNELIDSMQCQNSMRNNYRVGKYDILNIFIWDHPEFNGPVGQVSSESGSTGSINPSIGPNGYLVNSKGYTYVPLIGSQYVEGKSTEELREQFRAALSKYIRNPQIDVRVTNYRSRKIYIMGEIRNPGILPLTDVPLSLVDAINLSGGFIQDASDTTHIFVLRGNYRYPQAYWLNARSPTALLLGAKFFLEPGDVVFIATAGVTQWNRAIIQILPTLQQAWFTYSLTKTTT